MTTTQTQLRRGTSAQVAAMTPVDGEPVYNTTDDRLHMGDGSTAGGIPHATAKDVQNDTFRNGTVGGTANAITLTNTPPVLAYANKLTLKFKATGTNSSTTTVNVDGLGVKNIYKLSGTSLVALSGSEIVSGAVYELNYDGTQFQLGSGGGGGALTVVRQVFTSSGTYTPSSGMKYCDVEAMGGGGGGGNGSSNTTNNGGGGGGGGGAYSKRVLSAATIGASQTVTIGAAGGTTSMAALVTAGGGSNGAAGNPAGGAGGAGGAAGTGDISIAGACGGSGISTSSGSYANGGSGGGMGGGSGGYQGTPTGVAATANTGGGGGGGNGANSGSGAGGAGASGYLIVTEYCM